MTDPDQTRTHQEDGLSTVTLIAVIGVFVVVGAPLVWYLWTTLNEVLAGRFEGGRLLLSGIILLIFAGLLTILSRSVRRLDERPH